ncbi:tautomerase family protein [Flavobacterium sp. PL02]|jgi:phenylpyruvate tautomerase PptA (4-oxalocrotonate tautomerase family)|uniref:tautomerase family protein n=1 Tax=Flavobacterium sp. PL02 TaxID=3088354 RepID=UPI002B230371|nr:tautomerase family protein [Flavobacterium sp. PL02]MEA9413866.1 tautomerase family protein [Flavobacterium sp. PL02]
MPFVRISLPKKLSQETKENISISIHESLIQEFNIPQDDYFHVIEELESTQIKFPKSYLGITHSENIIYVQITAGQGRTKEQKTKLYAQIATRISNTTEILKSDIIIILLENNGSENWSFGNGEIQEQKHLKQLSNNQ